MTIRDLSSIGSGEIAPADVAIIGAGPAGITLALELEQRGARVVLLEAGGRDFSDRSQSRYAGAVLTPPYLDYPALDATRLRMFGGSSNHWNGWCRPLEEAAFEDRPWVADVSWPFGLDELRGDYAIAHEYCDLGRFQYDARQLSDDLGRPLLTDGMESVRTIVFRYSPPTRFAEKFGSILETGGVDVVLNANVVAFRARQDRVERVVVVSGPGEQGIEIEAEQFVMASGGVETVRLLAELETTTSLRVDSGDWLGTGFMEHPHGFLGAVMLPNQSGGTPLDHDFYSRRVPDVDDTQVRAGLSIDPDQSQQRGLMSMSVTLQEVDGPPLGEIDSAPGLVDLIEMARGTEGVSVFSLYGRTEQRPFSESTLRRVRGTDDLGLQRLRLDWRIDDRDLRDLEVFLELVAADFGSIGGVVRSLPRVGPLTGIGGGAHHMGGTRMHESREHGVVDPTGRVHGASNLYVCSSSTFPTGGFSNPTLTIVALAVRLARHLGDG